MQMVHTSTLQTPQRIVHTGICSSKISMGWRKAMGWGIWIYRGPSLVGLRPQRPRETARKKWKLRDRIGRD